MQVGDPKKAMALGAVALIVVSVAVFRAIPSGSGATPQNPPTANTQPGVTPPAAAGGPMVETAVVADSPAPNTLLNDPFSHPGKDLAARAPAKTSDASQPTEKPSMRRLKNEEEANDSVAPASPFGNGTQVGELPDPRENTGNSQPSEMRSGLRVCLKAVVNLNEPVALISVNDSPALRGGKGTDLGGAQIIGVGEGFVTLRFEGKTRRVRVGETVTL